MSYTALYRKFRPAEFEDVKGQDHIVTTLKNQIKADRIGHAYLFCGTRGTGKTTIAKIFAKAINCEHPVDGSPCGECKMCRAIAAGTSMNVIEIDAASNNGVDNIREIRDEVSYSPTEGRYKVYIIDEVHMLSIGAFNALLKTLEEPPAYVVFILATTEAHKIPVTILSRCQRYDFRRISIDTISARLTELMQIEKVEVEDKAIRYVAKAADGSMRDALSLLDQCIAFYLGEKLTYDHVLEVLGAVDTDVFGRFLDAIGKGDILGLIRQIDDLIIQGRELTQFFSDFTWYLRNLLLIKSTDRPEEVLDATSENLAQMKESAESFQADTLMRYIRIFSELSGQLKYASQKRILAEMTLIKICRPQTEQNLDSLTQRVSDLERKLENGEFVQAAPAAGESRQTPSPSASATEKKPAPVLPKAIPEDVKAVVADWKNVIRGMSPMSANYLKHTKLSLGGDNKLLIVFEDETGYNFINRDGQKEELAKVIADRTGKQVDIEIRCTDRGKQFEDSFVDIEKLVNMEITIEED